MKDLTSADLRALARDVIAGESAADVKTKARWRAIVKGGKDTATRTLALLSTLLTYAVEEGYRADNPARGIVLPSCNKRKIHLDASASCGKVDPVFTDAALRVTDVALRVRTERGAA
ncbi:hypothetical protein [Microvirga sesbaniae]|uniref:hypothetical protein n=1 Tax=Microvirga sesbaniae TaxID=681392 RepID=UPI0021C8FEF8|nr:hypothetical protein [Microvirga sp. HBU67692]